MFRNRAISGNITLIEALKKMDELDKKLLILMNNDSFEGLLSAGDIQRAIIDGRPLHTPVSEVTRKNIKTGVPGESIDDIRNLMSAYRMEFYPIVNEDSRVEEIYFWEDLFVDKEEHHGKFDLPIVIMAGGLGTRLRPLTNVIPKPLVPIGDKTMLEEILDQFSKYGCTEFHLSVNYKADLIKYYLSELQLPYSISYIQEDQPLGTAGSLKLLKGKLNRTFFVNNCDIMIRDDYAAMLKYHREQKNDITLIAAIKSYAIPYGTILSGENGQLLELKEKPDLNFLINSGMYILEPHLLDEIPDHRVYHLTDLIQSVKSSGGNVGVFPVSEKSWIDIGDWSEYLGKVNPSHRDRTNS
ncbi:MAG: hypothetical protein RIT43_1567 [Bacteroidota bacterium]|jgi:dTDP-glucose pyrophosphorylase/CBS domain-containing protein